MEIHIYTGRFLTIDFMFFFAVKIDVLDFISEGASFQSLIASLYCGSKSLLVFFVSLFIYLTQITEHRDIFTINKSFDDELNLNW